jgi:DNA-binding XRE family transcriptional regulator
MFLENKYTKWYVNIITQAKLDVNNRIEGYFEKHHIIPRSMGGTDAKDNIVKLTAREHFICHLLLTKMTNDHRMGIALGMMTPSKAAEHMTRYIPTSKLYEYARKQASLAKMGKNNPIFGKKIPCTQERKDNISKALKSSTNLKESRANPEYRKKISDVQSEETLLISVETGKIVSSWKNCHEIAKILNCTYANIKNARRDKRPVGRKNKFISEECFVVYRKDFENFQFEELKNSLLKVRKAQKDSLSKTGSKPKEKVKCHHCSKVGAKPVMMRFHFDNCKSKLI